MIYFYKNQTARIFTLKIQFRSPGGWAPKDMKNAL